MAVAKSRGGAERLPSMTDVAQRAGVSQTTVSFVVNDTPGKSIPEATRARVWAAVEALDYRPNALARSLQASRTNTVGLVSDRITSTPYGGEMIVAAQAVAWQDDVMLLMAESGGQAAIAERAVDLMLQRRVDGLIYGAMYHKEIKPPKATAGALTVLMNAYVADGSIASVVPDDERGGFEATTHVLGQGHVDVAYVQNEEPIPAARLRLEGHRQALAGAGLDPASTLVVAELANAVGGFAATQRIIERQPQTTAIVCSTDRMALGVYRALRAIGRRVPDDVSVIGFDNEAVIAEGIDPGLTTMQLPHQAMGTWAMTHLLQGLAAGSVDPVQHRAHCPIVERDSVAPPRSTP